MNANEKIIIDTLNTLDTIERVETPIVLQQAIRNNYDLIKAKSITLYQNLAVAASIIFLIGINIVTLIEYSKKSKIFALNNETNVVYKEYFSSEY